MPTFARTRRFAQDLKRLTAEQRQRFNAAVLGEFVVDLKTGRFRAGLRVKRVQATAGVWEMTWAPDGRATFEYGKEIRPGEPHVIWRRVAHTTSSKIPDHSPSRRWCFSIAGSSRAPRGRHPTRGLLAWLPTRSGLENGPAPSEVHCLLTVWPGLVGRGHEGRPSAFERTAR